MIRISRPRNQHKAMKPLDRGIPFSLVVFHHKVGEGAGRCGWRYQLVGISVPLHLNLVAEWLINLSACAIAQLHAVVVISLSVSNSKNGQTRTDGRSRKASEQENSHESIQPNFIWRHWLCYDKLELATSTAHGVEACALRRLCIDRGGETSTCIFQACIHPHGRA